MTPIAANLNRSVHLGRRDAFFERAMDTLCHPLDGLPPEQRLHHVQLVHDALRRARDHAFFASQSDQVTTPEVEFHHFLELKLQNVASAIAMIQHQLELDAEEGFLSRFLDAEPQQNQQPGSQYERRAEDILQGVWHMLRLAHATYFELRNSNLSGLSASEQNRYHRAYEAANEVAKAGLSAEMSTSGQISGPAPGNP